MRLVLWRNAQGAWSCFEDKCPHRLAPLSGMLLLTKDPAPVWQGHVLVGWLVYQLAVESTRGIPALGMRATLLG